MSGLSETVSSYPPPPPWASLYDESNPTPPPPPPPPSHGETYKSFGILLTTVSQLPSFADTGKQELFKSQQFKDIPGELKRLNKLLLALFYQLLESYNKPPEVSGKLIDQCELVFLNLHYLLNECRETQAREDLILTLRKQLFYRKQVIERLRTKLSAAQESLKALEKFSKVGAELSGTQ
ncbi:putative mediator of RNA polymerase II transcription subunit 7 [Monocercomonoides exilis]|uniref:putative mediator of RNA polymerase II transcription subunit 7 n=1 Tax=Monocercomonoides exilis TaxID=2049356 RepID=UPI0035593FDE|nr:putative mediator of RNA polymerase II transcription subunit 7 [Monocercomonoides exilis]|eukprot:MONOS_1944.1-p1 / transcript=MONOS_1944.1 / gene=MONOS_1944 / organism=Monocercomonoides_exilis_PA203 / gene_product=unspecified product / transcript_product=unspecified product / location=Mono_scaffold00037:96441-97240(+) / protein_length=179 / sequence_SO=supercontig / SO=protein_coding / is_pseudo=false